MRHVVLSLLLAACGTPSFVDGGPQEDGGQLDAGAPVDAGSAGDAGQPDGTATRRACTNTLGTSLSATHGRLDGVLVAIVPPTSNHACNADVDHVHLQVQAQGGVYDVAVNTTADVWFLARDGSEPAFDYLEGWHSPFKFNYPSQGVHSTDFQQLTPTALVAALQAELANVNHVSIIGTGYGAQGMHNVHYQDGFTYDGAIITRPLSPNARQLFFRFTADTF